MVNDPSTAPQDRYQLSDQLEHEKSKESKGKLENTLRQNNLLPVVFQLFKEMSRNADFSESRPSVGNSVNRSC